MTPIRCGIDAWAQQDVRRGDVVAWPTNLGWMMGPWLLYAALLNGASIALFQVGGLTPQRGYHHPCACYLAPHALLHSLTEGIQSCSWKQPWCLAGLRFMVGPLQSYGVCREYTACYGSAGEGQSPSRVLCMLSSGKRQHRP